MKDYLELSARTMSDGFHTELVSHELLVDAIERAVLALNDLDQIKKALFYGRPLGAKLQAEEAQQRMSDIQFHMLHDTAQCGIDLLHGIIGGATEAGEKLEALKKGLMGQGFDAVNLAEEVGDGFWYDAAILRVLGTTFESVQKTNIAKLQARFPEKFTEENANNRDLSAERKVLEGKQKARLDNWFILGNVAVGDVFDHPRLGNAQDCTTSRLILDKDPSLYKEGDILETKNTLYTLGPKAISL